MSSSPSNTSKNIPPGGLTQALRPGQLTMQNPIKSGTSLQLSEEEQLSILTAVENIFKGDEAFNAPEKAEDEEDGDDDEPVEVMNAEDQERRTEKLKEVAERVERLWWAVAQGLDWAKLVEIVERLADGGRDAKWRIPLGDSGILEFFLEILSTHDLRRPLKTQVLRLIGNSCADTDKNRARVVNSAYLPPIIFQLKDTASIRFVIPVLFNICVDYEPAQLQASNSFLSKELIELISSPRFDGSRALLGYVCKLLSLLITQSSETELAPENTPLVLLQIATNKSPPPNFDEFIALVNTAIAYLQQERFQLYMIKANAIPLALTVFASSHKRFSPPSNQEATKLLTQTLLSLTLILTDISSLPLFTTLTPLTSPLIPALQTHISTPYPPLQTTTCLILGNLARSDASCTTFIHVHKIHIPLISILRATSDAQLLHAALGFMKNLALLAGNKAEIGEAGIFDVLRRLWRLDALQQVQFSAVSLGRLLVVGAWGNVKEVVQRVSVPEDATEQGESRLTELLRLFERTDIEAIKMEIARLFTAVCRVLYTAQGNLPREGGDVDVLRKEFYTLHPDVAKPLSFMITQGKWPAVRSEGWFVFAIMAREVEGAKCVDEILGGGEAWEVLVRVVKGVKDVDENTAKTFGADIEKTDAAETALQAVAPESMKQPRAPAQGADMARVDRENALVLVSELLKSRGQLMSAERREKFESLLKGGGDIVLADRTSKATASE